MLTTNVEMHTVYLPHPCVLCGCHQGQQPERCVAVWLYDDEVSIGDVCPECVEAGPSGAAQQMRERAKDLRELSDSLERLANEVANVEDWVPIEELRAAKEASTEMRRKVPDSGPF